MTGAGGTVQSGVFGFKRSPEEEAKRKKEEEERKAKIAKDNEEKKDNRAEIIKNENLTFDERQARDKITGEELYPECVEQDCPENPIATRGIYTDNE